MALPMAGADWTDADAAGVAMLLHAAGTGCWWRSIAARRTLGHAARPQGGREWRILADSGDPARLGRVGGEWRWRCVTWLAEASLP